MFRFLVAGAGKAADAAASGDAETLGGELFMDDITQEPEEDPIFGRAQAIAESELTHCHP